MFDSEWSISEIGIVEHWRRSFIQIQGGIVNVSGTVLFHSAMLNEDVVARLPNEFLPERQALASKRR